MHDNNKINDRVVLNYFVNNVEYNINFILVDADSFVIIELQPCINLQLYATRSGVH